MKTTTDMIELGLHQSCENSSSFWVKASALHIPAHCEHPFWFNVNTYSGLT